MANVSIEQMSKFYNRLGELSNGRIAHTAVGLATNEYVAFMKNRVFKDGLNTAGNKIGDYSKKSRISLNNANKNVGKKQQKQNQLQALTGRLRGDVTIPRKTIKYTEFRTLRGRQIGYVDFKLNGSLQFSIQANENKVGYQNMQSAKIGDGLQNGNKKFKGFGVVFQPTEAEKEQYLQATANYYSNHIKQLVNQ